MSHVGPDMQSVERFDGRGWTPVYPLTAPRVAHGAVVFDGVLHISEYEKAARTTAIPLRTRTDTLSHPHSHTHPPTFPPFLSQVAGPVCGTALSLLALPIGLMGPRGLSTRLRHSRAFPWGWLCSTALSSLVWLLSERLDHSLTFSFFLYSERLSECLECQCHGRAVQRDGVDPSPASAARVILPRGGGVLISRFGV